MSERPVNYARWISSLVVLALLVVVLIASAVIWVTGDWEKYEWGLTLSLRILWGSWVVVALVTILTRVTIFGWSFRRYFRWAEGGMPTWAARFRYANAPWSKSGAASFSFTLAMAILFGGCVVASVVMWILRDVTGEWVFWMVFKIIWASWWVLTIALVLARVAVFGTQRKKALLEQNKPEHSESKT